MKTHFVRAEFDIYCNWEGIPPVYRIYVNEELFTERTWAWPITWHLHQILQIQAPAGEYKIEVQPVGPCIASFECRNLRIGHGPAAWMDPDYVSLKHKLRIDDES